MLLINIILFLLSLGLLFALSLGLLGLLQWLAKALGFALAILLAPFAWPIYHFWINPRAERRFAAQIATRDAAAAKYKADQAAKIIAKRERYVAYYQAKFGPAR